MVLDFHKTFKQPVGCGCEVGKLQPGRRALRASLIEEEAAETVAAIKAGMLVSTIDGLCDTLYVVYGTAVEMGVDLEAHFAEVHHSNMAKVGGGERADGKILKPAGWQGPDIVGILQTGRGRYIG